MNFASPNVVECSNCKYWRIVPTDLAHGLCQRHPPTIHPVQTNRGVQLLAAQPTTEREGGCAEGALKVVVQ